MARKLAYQALKLVGKNWGKSSLTIEKNRGNIVRLANRIEKKFGLENIHNLKPHHIAAVFSDMQAERLSATTLSGYATAARTIAFAIGKQNIVPRTNKELGFSRAGQRYCPIDTTDLELSGIRQMLYARNQWQGLAHDLRMHFGLRAKESLLSVKVIENEDMRFLKVEGTKGGRTRYVPIETESQAQLLNNVEQYLRKTSQKTLVPKGMSLKQAYDRQRNDLYRLGAIKKEKANAHVLRHAFVQDMCTKGISKTEIAERIGHGRTEALKHYGA